MNNPKVIKVAMDIYILYIHNILRVIIYMCVCAHTCLVYLREKVLVCLSLVKLYRFFLNQVSGEDTHMH